MYFRTWLRLKIHQKNGIDWKKHPIWKKKYMKIPIKIGCGTAKAFKQYFDKVFNGELIECTEGPIRIGGFNIDTQEITLWQVD